MTRHVSRLAMTTILLALVPVAASAAEAPASRPAGAKDPLAYKVHQVPGGTVAIFENWRIALVGADQTMSVYDSAPAGRERDFVLRVIIATPSAQDLANMFTLAPALVRQSLQQLSPTFRPVGEGQKCKVGGDAALLEVYAGELQGRKVQTRVLYVRRGDVGLAIAGIGTDEGFRDFGRSIEIVAQSISFKESALEAGLLGTWTVENYVKTPDPKPGEAGLGVGTNRSITILPNGTFTDTASTTTSGPTVTGIVQGGSRGRLVKRGNMLTFHYDDGATRTDAYELRGGALILSGKIFLRP